MNQQDQDDGKTMYKEELISMVPMVIISAILLISLIIM